MLFYQILLTNSLNIKKCMETSLKDLYSRHWDFKGLTLATHYSLIHRKDQTAWPSTRRICPITTLPFLTLITRYDMKLALSPPVWMTFEIGDILWCDLWMKHLWWHFHIALFLFNHEIWKCCRLIFFYYFGHYWNGPNNKFKYFKTGNSGPCKHFKLFDLKRNYIMYMLWFNFILEL